MINIQSIHISVSSHSDNADKIIKNFDCHLYLAYTNERKIVQKERVCTKPNPPNSSKNCETIRTNHADLSLRTTQRRMQGR